LTRKRLISRRSFVRSVVGTVVVGTAMGTILVEEARAQTTDGDSGPNQDAPGYGRSVPGLTDSDARNANRDPIGLGRGRRQRGITDTDSGARGDQPNNGRGTTDADRGDRAGYGRGQMRQAQGRTPAQPMSVTGSGFFVGAGGHILTSNHVIAGARSIYVTTSAGHRVPATVLRASAATDVALLTVAATPPSFLTLSSSRGVLSGAHVFTVGFPIASILGREPRYTEGAISALSGPAGDQTFFQISVPVQPGNSGGPLLTESGEVVGIIAASAAIAAFFRATGTLPQNLNWAVKSDYIAPLVPEMTPVRHSSREAAIAATNASVVFIEVER